MDRIHQQVILDTGPLVALINRREPRHEWVKHQLMRIQPPLFTCEAVISETVFLLQHVHNGIQTLKGLLETKSIYIGFQFNSEVEQVTDLYSSLRLCSNGFCRCLSRKNGRTLA